VEKIKERLTAAKELYEKDYARTLKYGHTLCLLGLTLSYIMTMQSE